MAAQPEHSADYHDLRRITNPQTVKLPTRGTHYMYIGDVGHIYDRRWQQSYQSSLLRWDRPTSRGKLSSKAIVPGASKLTFLIRSAQSADQIANKDWRKLTDGRFMLNADDRVLQYLAIFKSDNGDRYPALDRVTIKLR